MLMLVQMNLSSQRFFSMSFSDLPILGLSEIVQVERLHKAHVPLVMGSQPRKISNMIKDPRIQRYKSLQRLDIDQNFQGYAKQSKTYQWCVKFYAPPQQNFKKLCRIPVESESKKYSSCISHDDLMLISSFITNLHF